MNVDGVKQFAILRQRHLRHAVVNHIAVLARVGHALPLPHITRHKLYFTRAVIGIDPIEHPHAPTLGAKTVAQQ